ncbi:carboxylate-amine ligase [Allocatelliglobosispora scoriae]|uniref:Putative glutamate--cysteine ligase 2 n=1 Tax=Allocatelliglobosispora scoriae TaxID=643052 RepID=A0A841BZB4_9ACTN|nr:glutamate--cysteine ligase [Allocatelliglobosispora scoriae]MBB5872142.1 carboxylate-amine ligase [Allocatelliglobosispora scoriae]
MNTADPPRFGVEEEFLVVDPATRVTAPQAEKVIEHARQALGNRVSGELTKLQVETRTDPCSSVAQVHSQLVEARTALAASAVDLGLRVVATGTPVLSGSVPAPITEGARQDRGNATYRSLHDDQAICAVHVHVEMPDRTRALQVSNHLRPHLPVLLALTANSPHWDGRDTGYAGWRTMIWQRWPVAGPPPHFTSVEHYDETVMTLLSSGVLVDTGTVFWDMRPSLRHPTLEIRVADVPITAWESALYAAVIRALVMSVGPAIDRGEDAPFVRPEFMRAAYWRAARDGLDGDGIDVRTGTVVPMAAQVTTLVDGLRPILRDNGDHDLVDGWLEELLTIGGSAARQRAAAAERGDLADVVDHLIAHLT